VAKAVPVRVRPSAPYVSVAQEWATKKYILSYYLPRCGCILTANDPVSDTGQAFRQGTGFKP
jgi:hypothetical protein